MSNGLKRIKLRIFGQAFECSSRQYGWILPLIALKNLPKNPELNSFQSIRPAFDRFAAKLLNFAHFSHNNHPSAAIEIENTDDSDERAVTAM